MPKQKKKKKKEKKQNLIVFSTDKYFAFDSEIIKTGSEAF